MSKFYVCITTVTGYETALNSIVESLPNEWKDKYILVYQNDPNERITIFEDGHIEVYIKNNLHDYGNWIGIHKLIERGLVPKDSCFLFVHDTCKFGERTYKLTSHIANVFMNESDYDILWLSKLGQCNICLIKESAIQYGYNIYKDIQEITKPESVIWEWDPYHKCSPKSFELKHFFIPVETEKLGTKKIYSDNDRHVLNYPTIDMEKYYAGDGVNHPLAP
jgi:hypothetical protein